MLVAHAQIPHAAAERIRTDIRENPRARNRLLLARLDVLQHDARHFAIGQHLNRNVLADDFDFIIRLDFALEFFLGPELVAANDDVQLADELRQKDGFLQRRVAATNDDDVLVSEKRAVAYRAKRNAFSDVFLFARNVEHALFGSCRQQHAVRLDTRAIRHVDRFVLVHLDDVSRFVFRAKTKRLVEHDHRQFRAAHFLNARIVFNMIGFQQFSARCPVFDQARFQAAA